MELEKFQYQTSYKASGFDPYIRPKTAAANVGNFSTGTANRYGFTHIILQEAIKERVTYTNKDSFGSTVTPDTIAVNQHLDALLVNPGFDPKMLRVAASQTSKKQDEEAEKWRRDYQQGKMGEAYSEYIEAQVHGPIDWATDVAAIVIEVQEVKEGSTEEKNVETVAQRFKIPIKYSNRDSDGIFGTREEAEGFAAKEARSANRQQESTLTFALVGKPEALTPPKNTEALKTTKQGSLPTSPPRRSLTPLEIQDRFREAIVAIAGRAEQGLDDDERSKHLSFSEARQKRQELRSIQRSCSTKPYTPLVKTQQMLCNILLRPSSGTMDLSEIYSAARNIKYRPNHL